MNTSRLTTVLGLVFLLAAGSALAAEPGYVDLEWIVIPGDADEIQDIDLGPILMSMASDAEESGDDALAEALSMIKGVRVKSFSVDDDTEAVAEEAVKKIQAQMDSGDWKRMVYYKDGDETIGVHTFYAGKDLVGLMVLVYEPGDSVTFANIVGDLDLGTMMKLAKRIDGDSLEQMLEEYEDIDGVNIHISTDDD